MNEIKVIELFLPKQMDESETNLIVQEMIKDNDFTSIKDMGQIMKIIKEKYSGKIDLGLAGKIAKTLLSK